jgi:hypothetical protein
MLAIKTYWGSGSMALLILSLAPVGGEWSASATLPPGKDPSVPIEYEAGWAPELVLMFWRRDSLLTPCWD